MSTWIRRVAAASTSVLGLACALHVAAIPPMIVVVVVVALAAAPLVALQRRAERLRRDAAPAMVAGQRVYLVDGSTSAATAGPLAPRVFLGAQLCHALSDRQLEAVALHEGGHQRSLDPLRLALATPLLRLSAASPVVADLSDQLRHQRELAADARALRQGANRASLASAMIAAPAASTAPAGGRERLEMVFDGGHARAAWRGTAVFAWLVSTTVAIACLTTWHPLAELLPT